MPHLRIARPVSDLGRAADMYCRGLGLQVLERFDNHAGFDGVIIGTARGDYHFEFTYCRNHAVRPTPTVEDLIVFYLPAAGEWQTACARMLAAGFEQVVPFNPYWAIRGRTFKDGDGYRIVLECDEWR